MSAFALGDTPLQRLVRRIRASLNLTGNRMGDCMVVLQHVERIELLVLGPLSWRLNRLAGSIRDSALLPTVFQRKDVVVEVVLFREPIGLVFDRCRQLSFNVSQVRNKKSPATSRPLGLFYYEDALKRCRFFASNAR